MSTEPRLTKAATSDPQIEAILERVAAVQRLQMLEKHGLAFGDKCGVYIYTYVVERGFAELPESHNTEYCRHEFLPMPKTIATGVAIEIHEGCRVPNPAYWRKATKEEEDEIVTLEDAARVERRIRAKQAAEGVVEEIRQGKSDTEGVRDAAVARLVELEAEEGKALQQVDAAATELDKFFEGKSNEWRQKATTEALRDRNAPPVGDQPTKHRIAPSFGRNLGQDGKPQTRKGRGEGW